MTFDAAGIRALRPKGRPKPHARNNGYSHAEGGVATSYSAFGAFMGPRKCVAEGFVVICCVSHCRRRFPWRRSRRPARVFRNVASVAYQAPGGAAATSQSNEVSLRWSRCRRARRSAWRATTSAARARPRRVPRSAARAMGSCHCRCRGARPGHARSDAADAAAGHRNRACRRSDVRARGRSRPQPRCQRDRHRGRARLGARHG